MTARRLFALVVLFPWLGLALLLGALFRAPASSTRILDRHTGFAKRDDLFGWVPTEGLRPNGQPTPSGTEILAVGDSFTYGAGVASRETWPAALERLLGRPVTNAGVIAYGVDQMAMRAAALSRGRCVEALVVAIIPDDIRRCGCSRFFERKPWFEHYGKGWVWNLPGAPGRAPRIEQLNDGRDAAAHALGKIAALPIPRKLVVLLSGPMENPDVEIALAARYPGLDVLDLTRLRYDAGSYLADGHLNAYGLDRCAYDVATALVPSARETP
jgi:hypothetical protein